MKIQISLSAGRTSRGIEEDAYEYATHQVNFDRQTPFSQIQRDVIHASLFTAKETQSDSFQKGIERAQTEALRKNKTLRGTILWTR